jgi:hypothetical protein
MSTLVGIGAISVVVSTKILVVVPGRPGRNIIGEQCVAVAAAKQEE